MNARLHAPPSPPLPPGAAAVARVLVAGMSRPLAMAVEQIVRTVFPGAHVVHHDREATFSMALLEALAARCDLCVVDVLGLGWGTATERRQHDLLSQIIGRRRAVLLLPPGDGGGWLVTTREGADAASLLKLQHPASVADMRAALEQLRRQPQPVQPGLAAPPPPPESPRGALPDYAIDPTPTPRLPMRALGAGPAEAAPEATAPLPAPAWSGPVPPFRLDPAVRRAAAAACPALADSALLNLLLDVAQRDGAHEFRVGRQAAAVFNPAQNWISSNVSAALRKRLTQHRLMLQIAEIRPVPVAEVEDRARALYGRRDDGRRPLDAYLWTLVFHTFEDTPPAVDGALRLRLRRWPNFTRLAGAPDVFLQLAMLCLRGPHSVAGLRLALASHDTRQVDLFVLCALLSGHATVEAGVAEAAAPAAAPKAPPVRRGFLRALLDRLF